jgi:hypothetical protein
MHAEQPQEQHATRNVGRHQYSAAIPAIDEDTGGKPTDEARDRLRNKHGTRRKGRAGGLIEVDWKRNRQEPITNL